MLRKIIKIDQEKCNGCGLCASACHEGAIEIVNGKASLTREDYCDGLGDCLPACPVNAISFEMREAPSYNEKAVLEAKAKKERKTTTNIESELTTWPVQIKLVPVNAPFFNGSDLLIAADCTAFSYANIHTNFMRGRVTLIGCPKLDSVDYAEKLTDIIKNNDIKSIHVLRMQVPCCGGLDYAVKRAINQSGKNLSYSVTIISTDGKILDN
ncbi:MAG: 4Fe-4S binding protein [Spirochaetales bacterium]|uniref:ATP-binding protein n=1 Tax=Bullifex sp. TaxID=2815808 RepID=UPI002A4E7529|nr:4Fe-4S binding protein [Bullifex sp.]MDD7271322.1 4Fe-4S binding protein [Spirochaetales bacterium]MDY4067723.1 4Fe-4S binding protein [Bullifex sp.]